MHHIQHHTKSTRHHCQLTHCQIWKWPWWGQSSPPWQSTCDPRLQWTQSGAGSSLVDPPSFLHRQVLLPPSHQHQCTRAVCQSVPCGSEVHELCRGSVGLRSPGEGKANCDELSYFSFIIPNNIAIIKSDIFYSWTMTAYITLISRKWKRESERDK